ncbi:hypothetical protein ANOBCDAF_03963 [Pleomorphomonas sp. T1.2MG-36]|uniref:hypothetical protein n=1 Tax=Pleomorphomonas sp. T1.2MG-36 TaxID=3041167 RepID=UPI0024773263|nr:hypothetical protein [Pleomorphomonas sp. T1.2MG-36]CAI9417379.1 hypothetical protein ANOBCDAF_03963 [Pleomorphomonas sp. T1.2MG-36]
MAVTKQQPDRFVELNREFRPLSDKHDDLAIEDDVHFLRMTGGALSWSKLLEHDRVVVLSEAASGKTQEFRGIARRLCQERRFSLFLEIKDLAGDEVADLISPDDNAKLQEWLGSDQLGWFFLDARDEALLANADFKKSLRSLRKALGSALKRAHVFVSCRHTDWQGSADRAAVADILGNGPSDQAPASPIEGADALASQDWRDVVLAPYFDREGKRRSEVPTSTPKKQEAEPVVVVRMMPLDAERMLKFVQKAEGGRFAADASAIIQAIQQAGLEPVNCRPGDLLRSLGYWGQQRRLGSRLEMMEHSVAANLEEWKGFRADGSVLSVDDARRAAELLAAALTLSKEVSLIEPGSKVDSLGDTDARRPEEILTGWSPAEIETLLRRPLFAPATRGRVRLHHRETQEFLTGCWLRRLYERPGGRRAVSQILFCERYGVQTVVRTLRPAAAWLALWEPEFLAGILAREPMTLLLHGDPGSLPIDVRRELLRRALDQEANGNNPNPEPDDRNLFMFSDARLGPDLVKAWQEHQDEDARRLILAIATMGRIEDCRELARSTAIADETPSRVRVPAIELLEALGDTDGLRMVADWLRKTSLRIGHTVVSSALPILFPTALSFDGVIELFERYPSEPHNVLDFSIDRLFAKCSDAQARTLLEKVHNFLGSPPSPVGDIFSRNRNAWISYNIGRPLKDIVQRISVNEQPTIALLSVIIWAYVSRSTATGDLPGEQTLAELIKQKPKIVRGLFWLLADNVAKTGVYPTSVIELRLYEIFDGGLGEADIQWLLEDLEYKERLEEKKLALDALLYLVKVTEAHAGFLQEMKQSASTHQELTDLIEDFYKPRPPRPEFLAFEASQAERERKLAERSETAKRRFLDFALEVRAAPAMVDLPEDIGKLDRSHPVFSLLNWAFAACSLASKPPLPQLAEPPFRVAFGDQTWDRFAHSLQELWRRSAPEEPASSWREGSPEQLRRNLNRAIGAGLTMASASPNWAGSLSVDDVRLVFRHVVLSRIDDNLPVIDVLLVANTPVVEAEIKGELSKEWTDASCPRGYLWNRINPEYESRKWYTLDLSGLALAEPNSSTENHEAALRWLRAFGHGDSSRRQLFGTRLLAQAQAAINDEALYFLLLGGALEFNPELALPELKQRIEGRCDDSQDYVARMFIAMFRESMRGGPVSLDGFEPEILFELLAILYAHFPPRTDPHHQGVWSPDQRDKVGEVRDNLQKELLSRSGKVAHTLIRRVADELDVSFRKQILQQARLQAERDADLPVWSAAETRSFGDTFLGPLRTCDDLFGRVGAALLDIADFLLTGDFSSANHVRAMGKEEAVQLWLADNLRQRLGDRYKVTRELEVHNRKKPDIEVESREIGLACAVEIKRGDSWTIPDLQKALHHQLVGQYLKPETRRRGFLVISSHGEKAHWEVGAHTRGRLTFTEVIERLQAEAAVYETNLEVDVRIKVIGLLTDSSLATPA